MTEEQYSVRWRISLLNANGNVQTRRRLTIYGALPGGVCYINDIRWLSALPLATFANLAEGFARLSATNAWRSEH